MYEGEDEGKRYTQDLKTGCKTHSKDFNDNFTPVVAVYQEGNRGVDGGLEIIPNIQMRW